MPKKTAHPKSVDELLDQAVDGVSQRFQHLPPPVRNLVAQLASGPIIGLVAGGLLLFGGIFLLIAWNVSFAPWIDAHRYSTFVTGPSGRIVDAWVALEFDPDNLPNGKLRWFGHAKVSRCVVVAYPDAAGKSHRRGFCGNHFDFSDSFDMSDLATISPDVPFAFARDAKGFMVEQIRLGADALNWLRNHPPYSTFMLGEPPSPTAYDALLEQFDDPVSIASTSWSTQIPDFPLAIDPAHPDEPMPAKFVDARRDGAWIGGFIVAILFGVIGTYIWRIGLGFVLGGLSPALFWLVTVASLLTVPWWGDALPKVIRYINHDWGEIAALMVDDLERSDRLIASAPDAMLMADGERIEIRADRGRYSDTFGKIPFQPPPKTLSAKDAIAALTDQTSAYVAGLDSAALVQLFVNLRALDAANLKHTQSLFYDAAIAVLKRADADARSHLAAKNFLLFASGGHFYQDKLDALEVTPRNDN